MNSTSSSVTPATSSIASGPAATRSRTWRVRTVSPPLATWRTCRSAWAGSCAGTPCRETIVADPEAAALLERPYRAPWDAERDALIRRG